jgi:hypothetical protein
MARKQSAGSTAGKYHYTIQSHKETQVHIIGNIAYIIYMSLYYISGVTRLMLIQEEIQDKTKKRQRKVSRKSSGRCCGRTKVR